MISITCCKKKCSVIFNIHYCLEQLSGVFVGHGSVSTVCSDCFSAL